MSTSYEMTCCVCGDPAELRCGPYVQAGVSVRFCSTEHQRLVWPVHKLVCGPDKANLREMPQLSTGEIKQLRDMADLPTTDSNFFPPERRADILLRYGGLNPTLSQVFEADRLPSRNTPWTKWLANPTPLGQEELARTRDALHGVLTFAAVNEMKSASPLRIDPLTHLAVVKSILTDQGYGFPKHLLTQTLHRALMLCSTAHVVYAAAKLGTSASISTAVLQQAATAYLSYILKYLTFPSPDDAAIEAGSLSLPFSLPFGCRPGCVLTADKKRIAAIHLVSA